MLVDERFTFVEVSFFEHDFSMFADIKDKETSIIHRFYLAIDGEVISVEEIEKMIQAMIKQQHCII